MKKSNLKISPLNLIFAIQLVFFGLIVTGILPRNVVPYFVTVLAIYVLVASTEDASIFFIRSIPFFIAIPLTATFDNFNTWRIIAGIIFLKWLWPQISNGHKGYCSASLGCFQFSIFKKGVAPERGPRSRGGILAEHVRGAAGTGPLLGGLMFFAVLSIIPAPDKVLAVKRVLYFLNLSLMGFVIYDLSRNIQFAKRLINNIPIPVIIVTLVGFIQLASTYFIDIYQFMRLWGEGIQCNQFGNQWCDIAVQVGNTWFAYYGEQLSLRMFSLFTDSHSFPLFILLGLPAIFAIAISEKVSKFSENLKRLFITRSQIFIIWVPIVFLAMILSGTRGIWAGSIAGLLAGLFFIFILRLNKSNDKKNILIYTTSHLTIFFLLFTIAFPIFESPQFLLSKGNSLLFGKRIRSIIDLGETSNSQRIEIWKASLMSIKNNPFLGIGIGNFPIVLNQKLELAKAGSSAHNAYLHIASEMGLPALFFGLWFLLILLKKTYLNFVTSKDWLITIYNCSALIFIPWFLAYLLTDATLFDERIFLIFTVTSALVLGIKNPDQTGQS